MKTAENLHRGTRWIAIALLRAYKWAVSPMFLPACRYVPTCSEYAMEAVDRYGIFRGGALSMWRLLRCNPFARGGVDPVVKPGVPHSCESEPLQLLSK